MTKPLFPNGPSTDDADAEQTDPPELNGLAYGRCATCEQRWEDVRFYGLPPSALCGGCPHRSEWTGKLFDGFE